MLMGTLPCSFWGAGHTGHTGHTRKDPGLDGKNLWITCSPYILSSPTHTPFFFSLVHSPLKSFISWEWAIKKIRIFFFPSPQSFVTCPIKLTATYKEKYPLEGLDALQDFQLGHPVSLLCPCAHCPGADRSGERKKKSEEVGEEDGGGDEYQVLRQNKKQNKFPRP